ncbi:GMC family oxidoreductase [Nodularia sp. LEGE 04288]|uniref:GMC oxidoreductase n=1 Tax=Nodularia sp. LEGE 04288 TaxID=1828639 RepID=UPI001D1073F9|nr:GMC family oxidoreductase [Nodularia sp. LEGE 04288]MCC2692693.1 GMC family oxidoreductase [Nodularia sp. LEGE 04288]
MTQDQTITCDICIIGAGAAGITLAHELRDSGMEVVLLESGGMKFEDETQDLNRGNVVDLRVHGALEDYRRRRFGGATTAWGGRCVPFDQVDFESRPYVPHSGWPITKGDLDPYYARAHVYCDIGSYTYKITDLLSSPEREKTMIPDFKSADISIDKLYLFSPPTNFGKKYLDILQKSSNIKVYLYANCLQIMLTPEGDQVNYLKVASLRKNEFSVSAKQYILAAGGLEVTRLLLLSNNVQHQGIGNQYDLVGRFYMCHVYHRSEVKFPNSHVISDYEKTFQKVYCLRAISINENVQKQHQLLNHRAYLERPDSSDTSHKNAILSAIHLANLLKNKQANYQQISQHLKNIVFDFDSILKFSAKWINKRIISQRKLPPVLLKSDANTYTLRIDSEQIPNPFSRVTLSDQRDNFGLKRLKVDWQYTDLDVDSPIKTAQLIKQALTQSDAGQIRLLPNTIPKALGGHHLGTTRMASSPVHGVVDENCQVHGVNNLYIASSSIFPTSSYANPTLTIVAIAIRLADYIKRFYS